MGHVASSFARFLKIVVLAAIPLVVMAVGAFVTLLVAVRGREVVTPDVVGMDRGRATRTLLANRLRAVYAGSRFSAKVGAGCVARQQPEAGTRTKADTRVRIWVSEGRMQVAVPSVNGLVWKEAESVLLQSGLQPGLVCRSSVAASTRDVVVQQYPAAGSTGMEVPYVNLLVNRPSPPTVFLMPDLGGLRASDASAFLARNGFRVKPFEYEASVSGTPGTVVSQSPQAGAPVSRVNSITLVVCR